MYSKAEAYQLKKEFWTAFGKSFPRKWILYRTKIKNFSFKFSADNKSAEVGLYLEMKDPELRKLYFEKIQAVEALLKEEYLPEAIFYEDFYLESGKPISKISVTKREVSVFNKNTWTEIFEFFVQKMMAFEEFYSEFEEYLKDV